MIIVRLHKLLLCSNKESKIKCQNQILYDYIDSICPSQIKDGILTIPNISYSFKNNF